MTKRRSLPVRALGAEPCAPDIPSLAGWVSRRRGSPGDLTSFLLETSLAPQIGAGVTMPCTGGKFYRDRLLSSFAGVEEGVITGETDLRPDALTADAGDILTLTRGAWCTFPAPHLIGITDRYYRDADDVSDALMELYRRAMRTMRDAGVKGHVLICGRADETELSELARQKVFFFHPDPGRRDLETLLEYQHQIAAGPGSLPDLFLVSGEYELARLILIDPDDASIGHALRHMDPDQITAGGYCTGSCESYWKDLVGRAFYTA